MKLILRYCLFLQLAAVMLACNNSQKTQPQEKKPAQPPSLKSIFNIRYTEVKRVFASGFSFSEDGYQIEPNWRLAFPSEDSVNIWNPARKLFVNAPVTFDHDSVYNVAWAWLRLKKLSKDSLVFQVLQVRNKVIENEKSIVYMTLYADEYIRNTLHRKPLDMQRPSAGDTTFIKRKSAAANADLNKAFAATQPTQLIPKTSLITVEQIPADTSGLLPDQTPIAYLLPEYNITINKAYEDFHYAFSAWVDEKGNIIFRKSVEHIEPEFEKPFTKAITGIVNGYLKAYLKTTPGTTLGIPHASIIILNVRGKK